MIEPQYDYCSRCGLTFRLVDVLPADGEVTRCAEGCGLRFQHGSVKRHEGLARVSVRATRKDAASRRKLAWAAIKNPFREASHHPSERRNDRSSNRGASPSGG